MRQKSAIGILWGLALFFTACAHRQIKPDPGRTAEEFVQDQAQRNAKFRWVSGRADLFFEAGDRSVRGRGMLASDLDGKFRLEMRDQIGRLHYLAALDSPNFVAQYPSQKVAYRDHRLGLSYFKKYVGISLSVSVLQRLLFGLLEKGISAGQIEKWHWDAEEGRYEAWVKVENRRAKLSVDPELMALRNVDFDEGKSKVSFSDFRPCCNPGSANEIALSRMIKISDADKRSAIEFAVQEIYLAQRAFLPNIFNPRIPSDQEVVWLDKEEK